MKSAFTLIELLVSITIISMMAVFSISAYPTFSEQISVSTESYKFLSYMRETQVFGISSFTTPGVKTVYGFKVNKTDGTIRRFKWENPTQATNESYINNSTDTGEEFVTLNNRFEISKICFDEDCTQNSDTLYTFYKRPNPEGRLISVLGSIVSPNPSTDKGHDKVTIFIRSKKNVQFEKKLVILQTGQMYVGDW